MNTNKEWLDFAMGMYKKLQEMGFSGPWGENNLDSLFKLAKQVSSMDPDKMAAPGKEQGDAGDIFDSFWHKETKSPAGSAAFSQGESGQGPFLVSIYESARDISLHAILNGIASQKDLSVSVSEGEVKLAGSRVSRRDGKVESFFRIIALPSLVDPAGAAATYKNGFLNITIPKKRNEPWTQVNVRFI